MQLLLKVHRLSSWCYAHRAKPIASLLDYINYLLFNCSIPGTTSIGRGTVLSKGGIAVVLHERSVIGKNCVVGSCVTVGGRSQHPEVPVIGNNVYLATGCKVLGPIQIGDDVVVAPNSVVLESVPSNVVVAGIPAKIVKTGVNMRELV